MREFLDGSAKARRSGGDRRRAQMARIFHVFIMCNGVANQLASNMRCVHNDFPFIAREKELAALRFSAPHAARTDWPRIFSVGAARAEAHF
jgi:hypothetical protein